MMILIYKFLVKIKNDSKFSHLLIYDFFIDNEKLHYCISYFLLFPIFSYAVRLIFLKYINLAVVKRKLKKKKILSV